MTSAGLKITTTDVGAVLLDVLAEFGCNLAVALEEVLARHAFLTWSAAAGNDVLGTGESLLWIDGVGDVGAGECAVAHLIVDAMHAGLIDIVKADVGGEAQHKHTLNHVGADHAASANDHKLVVC